MAEHAQQSHTGRGASSNHPTLTRLATSRSYYSGASRANRNWHYGLKFVEVVVAASIPVGALLGSDPALLGVLGAVIVVLSGAQQIYQPHFKWLRYRSANERVKREEHLFKAEAGPYEGEEHPLKLLAVRLEDAIAEEHSEWSSRMQSADATTKRPS